MNTTHDNIYYDAPKLFLDDFRSLEEVYEYTKQPIYTFPKWDVVRSFDDFVKYFKENEMPLVVSFDHDLIPAHYALHNDHPNPEARQSAWEDYHNAPDHLPTGYDCLKWLVDYCHDNAVTFPHIFIHTMNTTGYQNMVHYYHSAVRNKFIKVN
jgi:hypothetical protein